MQIVLHYKIKTLHQTVLPLGKGELEGDGKHELNVERLTTRRYKKIKEDRGHLRAKHTSTLLNLD